MNPELVEFIRDTIRTRGPQSFAWFMEQALYHPVHGYYSSGRASIGRTGDYFTNVSVGPLFGQLLAAQFIEMWERLGKIDNFTIFEQGAHDGRFAHDVLTAIQEKSPDFFFALRYLIIEPFPVLQDRQSQTLKAFRDKVDWSELESFVGVHFSNELLDAMPVHLIVSSGDGWLEKSVALDRDKFVFVDQAIIDLALQARVNRLPAQPARYETEINLAALDWIDNLSTKLTRGYVLIVDYGSPRHHRHASLRVSAQHRHLASPFDEIGNADICSHVDWTGVAERGEEGGMHVVGFTDQHHFITGIISEFQELPKDEKAKRALQTLLHPEMLGRAFQVLALARDVPAAATTATTEDVDLATGRVRPTGGLAAPLAGFKFARDPRLALGL